MEWLGLLLPIAGCIVMFGVGWMLDARRVKVRAAHEVRAAHRPVIEERSDEDQVLELCAEIQKISETGETTLPGVYTINPRPSRLELELGVGPAATIWLNEELIERIQDHWDLQVQLEREACEKAKAERAAARLKATQQRRHAAKLALAERKFKWWHRRILRGLCCAACFGEHPTDICVGDRFRARRVPSSVMSPYSEKLGMYGVWETPDLTAHEPSYLMKAPARNYSPGGFIDSKIAARLLGSGVVEAEELRSWSQEGPIRVKRSPSGSWG